MQIAIAENLGGRLRPQFTFSPTKPRTDAAFCFSGAAMQITINVDDQSGQVTIEAEGQEPYQCESIDECLEYLSDMLKGEEANEPGQEAEAAEPSTADMWSEEAAKRPAQPGLMR